MIPSLDELDKKSSIPSLDELEAKKKIGDSTITPLETSSEALDSSGQSTGYKYSWDSINTEPKKEIPAVRTYATSTEGRAEVELPKTVEEAKKAGEKPTIKNYVATVAQKSAEHIGEFVKEGLEGTAEGLKTAKEGLKMTGLIQPTIEDFDKISKEYPDNIQLRGFVKVLAGTSNAAMSILTHATPVGIGFTEGTKLLETTVPRSKDLTKYLFAPVSSLYQKITGEELTGTGKDIAQIGDLIGAIAMFKGGEKGLELSKKLVEDKPLTAEDVNLAIKSAIDVAKDPESFQKIAEEKGFKIKDAEKIAQEQNIQPQKSEGNTVSQEVLQEQNPNISEQKGETAVEPAAATATDNPLAADSEAKTPFKEQLPLEETPNETTPPIKTEDAPKDNLEETTKVNEPINEEVKQPEVPSKAEPTNDKPTEPSVTGISKESQENRAKELGVEPAPRGKGITPEEAVERGKQAIKEGADAEKIAAEYKKTKKISVDDFNVLSTHADDLAKETNKAADENGVESTEYKDALAKELKWNEEIINPIANEFFHQTGMRLQGDVDVDTGSYTGLKRAWQREHKKDFTPNQSRTAKELSDKVKKQDKIIAELQKKLTDHIDNAIKEEPKIKLTSERKEKLKQSINDRLARLSNVKFAIENSDKTNVITEITGLIKDVAELGGLEFIDAVKNVIEKLPHLKDFIQKNNEDIKNEFNKPENDLFTRFIDKKDSKFSPQDVRDIWGYAKKEYLDKESSFRDMLSGVSKDLGLSAEQVLRAIEKPKGARVISDEMYRTQNRRTDAVNRAKQFVKSGNDPKIIKFFKNIPSVFFALKTAGHGTVGMITHAGMNIFKPSSWNTYFPQFFKQFGYAFGDVAKYEKAMQNLQLDPHYTFWKRNGLAVDPNKKYDDYQGFKNYFGKLSKVGDRGFNALKVYRLDLAKSIYEGLSNVEKADPNTAKEIASIVNHSTGTADLRVPETLGVALFAPRLEASRWARLITSPAKAASTFINWNKATPSEKVSAKIYSKRAGEMIATYSALLAANAAILSLTGSNQKINITDPTQPDFMKFKFGDKTLDMTGGMLSNIRFLSGLIKASTEPQQISMGMHKSRMEKIEQLVGSYLRGKLSPFGSTVADISTQADFKGKPLPFSSDKPKKGEKKYTWIEYLAKQQTPIPVAEAINNIAESMKEKGMTTPQISDILEGILIAAIVGGTGARIATSKPMTKKQIRYNKKHENEFTKFMSKSTYFK